MLGCLVGKRADFTGDAGPQFAGNAVTDARIGDQPGAGDTPHQAQLAQARYVQHVAGQGRHPRLAEALAAAAENNDQHRFDAILARIMAGILRVE